MSDSEKTFSNKVLTLIPLCIALNLVLGGLVHILKLPIYLDATGTILATLLVGWRAGVVVGVASFLLASLIISPVYVYFIGTQAVIAIYIYLLASKLKSLRSLPYVCLTGVGLGIVAGIVSAPVIVAVFGGVSGSGRDIVTAILMNSGQQVMKAVILSGAASEPVDKLLQVLIAYSLIKGTPKHLLQHFSNKVLRDNRLL